MAVITFKHSCDNDKVEKLIDKYGVEGYYVLFRTIEMFASNKNNPIILDTQKDFDILMHYLKGVKYERAKEIYDNELKGKYNIKFIVDDRDQVVKMWRSLGLTVLQCAEGNF